jgi:hypothetical protein
MIPNCIDEVGCNLKLGWNSARNLRIHNMMIKTLRVTLIIQRSR